MNVGKPRLYWSPSCSESQVPFGTYSQTTTFDHSVTVSIEQLHDKEMQSMIVIERYLDPDLHVGGLECTGFEEG